MSLLPTPLDEYPIHQTPLPMARVDSSDRNFYDRCYFNAMDRAGEVMVVAGAGVYPNLGVQDAYFLVRRGDRQQVARFSTTLDERALTHEVGGFRVEVLDPLHSLRLVCDPSTGSGTGGIGADLTWRGATPAVLEQPHLMMGGLRPTLLAQRFAQAGSWEGSLTIGDERIEVTPELWHGTRDRSWGIRPSGEAEPAGRTADLPFDGFWWLYVPMQFDDFTLVVILQESPDGFRSLNDAIRIDAGGQIEQLGWPRVEFDYRSGTRHPLGARIHLTTAAGEPLLVEVETLMSVALHIGAGYGGDPDWAHGQWKGADWSEVVTYDLTDPEVASRIPWGVSDHSARARMTLADGSVLEGRGLFEHASMGRHDPTGFADWMAVAP